MPLFPPASGQTITQSFLFSYDTPGLSNGVVIYTPVVGEFITFFVISIPTTPWDGTTPQGNFGQYNGTASGILQTNANMTQIDYSADGGTGITFPDYRDAVGPFFITEALPIYLVVSQDGTKGGADPGSTQGEGVFYVVSSKP